MHVFQRHIGRLLPVAVIGILSACSVASKAQDQPATPVVADTGDCAQGFVVVTPEAPGCGFTLTTAGKLTQDGQTVADPLVASYRQDASGNAAVAAGQVVLFPPSPSGRFRILQACESAGADALCWKVFVFDREAGQLKEAVAGKYGPDRWVSWSPDEQHAALVSRNEGAAWVHVVEAAKRPVGCFPRRRLDRELADPAGYAGLDGAAQLHGDGRALHGLRGEAGNDHVSDLDAEKTSAQPSFAERRRKRV